MYDDMICCDMIYYDYYAMIWYDMTIGYFIDIYIFFSFFSLKFFAKVEHCRLQNTVESLGKLCYGRAYLDFSPGRFVSSGSPLA